jgi:proline/betaine transport protein TphA
MRFLKMALSKRTFFSGVFGNALEWYDFTAYAFFAPVLAELFFPSHDPYVSLLLTFSVFALGFFVRPLGGLLFGFISDHFGRRTALIISIVAMSFPTLLLGLLPTYAVIGFMAPLILTLLRVVQGAAVSGELCTSATYLIEHAGQKRRGLAGSFVMCSAFLGMAVSSAFATIITHFTNPQQLSSWGWRLPFLIGGVIGLIGLVIRLGSVETPAYQEAAAAGGPQKIDSIFKDLKHILSDYYLWMSVLLTAMMAVGDWFLIAYFNTFLTKTVGMPLATAMSINLFILCVFTILLPCMGHLSDNLGRKPVLRAGFIGFILLSYPIFWLLNHGTITSVVIGELLFAIILAPIASIIPTSLAELFHVRMRNTSMALGYNLSQGFFGGTAPLIAILLVAKTGNHYSPSFYLIFCAIVSWWALSRIKESYKNRLL